MPTTSTTYNLGPCDCCDVACVCDCTLCNDACAFYTDWQFTLNGFVAGTLCNLCTTDCQTVFGGTRTLTFAGMAGGCCTWYDTAGNIPAPGFPPDIHCNPSNWNEGNHLWIMQLCKPLGVFKLSLTTGQGSFGPSGSSDNGAFANPQELCDQTSVAGTLLIPFAANRCCYPSGGTAITLTPVGTPIDCTPMALADRKSVV